MAATKEKTRILKFIGTADKLDMRPAVGLADDDSDEAKKFIFYRLGTRSSDEDAQKIAAQQWADGVEVTEDQALAILTNENRLWGFADVTNAAGSKDTMFAEDVLGKANVEGVVLGANALTTPVQPAGDIETGYPPAETKATGAKPKE